MPLTRSAEASVRSHALIRVLLVEDDDDLARSLRESMEVSPPPGVRFELHAAGTLREALGALRRTGYDAVLLDLGLPDSQGLETLARIHRDWPRTPIVVLTGQSDETLAVQAAAEGAQDYLVKGCVDPATLVRTIRYAIERTRSEAALRRSEERLRLALAAANMGIWEWSLLDDRLTLSPELLERMGVAPEAAPRTLSELLALVHADDREAVARAAASLRAARERAERPERFEATFRLGPAGRWALSKGRLVEPEAGLVIGTITDVTELKELESRLIHSQKLESIGRLAGGVAHDFNNLLTVILGSASLAEADPAIGGTRALEHLRNIRQASERAAQLTSRLLTFARKQVVRLRAVDLSAVVRDLNEMLGRLLGEAVTLDLRLEQGLPAVRADPIQLEQVIVNLAVNARDAMPHGGTLTLETSRRVVTEGEDHGGVPPGDWVRLRVTDTGLGMSPSVLTHVFEPFFTTKEGAGTGLGLATCYGIVTQLGGHITVQSAPERGATFTVHLPSAPEPLDAPAGSLAPPPGGRETLLVVEDDELVRRLASASLSRHGYVVLTARTPGQALRMVRDGARVDLLVTDVVMPEQDGRELARAVRALAPSVKVLFMSGYTGDALDPGEHFLQKPFTPSTLALAVRAALDGAPRPRLE